MLGLVLLGNSWDSPSLVRRRTKRLTRCGFHYEVWLPVHVTRVRYGKKRERERCIPVRQCRPRNEWDKEIKTGPYLLSVSPSLFFLPKKKKKKKWFQASPGPPPLPFRNCFPYLALMLLASYNHNNHNHLVCCIN
jgi:hypothetical protein